MAVQVSGLNLGMTAPLLRLPAALVACWQASVPQLLLRQFRQLHILGRVRFKELLIAARACLSTLPVARAYPSTLSLPCLKLQPRLRLVNQVQPHRWMLPLTVQQKPQKPVLTLQLASVQAAAHRPSTLQARFNKLLSTATLLWWRTALVPSAGRQHLPTHLLSPCRRRSGSNWCN